MLRTHRVRGCGFSPKFLCPVEGLPRHRSRASLCSVPALNRAARQVASVRCPLQCFLYSTLGWLVFPLSHRRLGGEPFRASHLAAGKAQLVAPAVVDAGTSALHVGDGPRFRSDCSLGQEPVTAAGSTTGRSSPPSIRAVRRTLASAQIPGPHGRSGRLRSSGSPAALRVCVESPSVVEYGLPCHRGWCRVPLGPARLLPWLAGARVALPRIPRHDAGVFRCPGGRGRHLPSHRDVAEARVCQVSGVFPEIR